MSGPLPSLNIGWPLAPFQPVQSSCMAQYCKCLVAMAGLTDGRKVVVAIEPGYRESSESWSALLRDLKIRGMCCHRRATTAR